MYQIHTKIDKNLKKFRFLKILFKFCLFFQKLGGLESHKRSKRKEIVVQGLFEEGKAICSGKMHQIQTEINKKIKSIRFLEILFKFCRFF